MEDDFPKFVEAIEKAKTITRLVFGQALSLFADLLGEKPSASDLNSYVKLVLRNQELVFTKLPDVHSTAVRFLSTMEQIAFHQQQIWKVCFVLMQ